MLHQVVFRVSCQWSLSGSGPRELVRYSLSRRFFARLFRTLSTIQKETVQCNLQRLRVNLLQGAKNLSSPLSTYCLEQTANKCKSQSLLTFSAFHCNFRLNTAVHSTHLLLTLWKHLLFSLFKCSKKVKAVHSLKLSVTVFGTSACINDMIFS